MATVNRQITLAARPLGFPRVSDFSLVFSPVPAPAPGEVLVRTIYLSLDPAVREQMDDVNHYARPVAIGEVMIGGAVAFVVQSLTPEFAVGDAVQGMFGWQEYAVARGGGIRKLDLGVAPISTALGVLGMPGLTAYFGLLDLCDPQPRETVVVSGAAGAVGMLAGQIAKIKECRVVGMAESDAKVAWLVDELGFDAAINHRTAASLDDELQKHCPEGIDVYFDNVGGTLTDAVIKRIRSGARIAICGQSSQDNLEEPEMGPRWLSRLIVGEAKLEGFLVSAYAARFPAALEQLTRWLQEGKLKYREDVAQGIEAAPKAFIGMLQGNNEGKQLVQLSEL